jgi:substrate import-associated zinc metallohydrolase lipoprotein
MPCCRASKKTPVKTFKKKKMKTQYTAFLALALFLALLTGCQEKEEDLDVDLVGLGGDTWTRTALDDWLSTNYVSPYNIEVKYRFDRYEVALNRTLVPPQEAKVIQVMDAIKKTWILPYEQQAGETFIKKLSPKQFVLVGSPEFNTNGTITLGTAEGGRKVVLYKINDFDKSKKEEVKEMLHTIHHEFGHILHQTILYPEEYQRVTTSYTANWNDFSLADARSRGFITEYARNNADDDFVEMVSIMLIEGKQNFDAIVDNTPESGRAALRQKEQLVVRYFKEAWNIDFYALQARAQTAINTL